VRRRSSARNWLGEGTRQAPTAFLWPFGPCRRRRALSRRRPCRQRGARSAAVCGLHEGPSLRRLDPEALQDQRQERSPRSRRLTQALAPESWQGFSGTYRRDAQDWSTLPHPSSGALVQIFRYDRPVTNRDTPDAESLRLELQEAMVTFRHWTSQTTQAAGFIATADVVLLTYGFTQKKAIVLLLASALPIIVLQIYVQTLNAAASLIRFALNVERKLLIREDSLAATYVRLHLRPLASKLAVIENINDKDLRNLDLNLSWRWFRKRVPTTLCAASIAQLGLFVFSLVALNYRFM